MISKRRFIFLQGKNLFKPYINVIFILRKISKLCVYIGDVNMARAEYLLSTINEDRIQNNPLIKPKYKVLFNKNLQIMLDTHVNIRKWISIIRMNIRHN
jgi:hypothetical protein